MRVLVATGVYPPDIGGPATYSQLLREKLPERGIEVKILTFGEVRYLPKYIRHIVFFCKAVIRSIGCDIIFAQDPVSVGLPSFIAARVTFKKFFIRVAGDYAWEQAAQRYGITDSIDDFQKRRYGFKTEFLRAVERFVVGRAHTVITPSMYFRELVSNWDRRQKRVFHIYNGIEFPESVPTRDEAREGLGIPTTQHVVVSAGRLVPWKGFDTLIEVMRELYSKNQKYHLYILGTGPDKEKLERLNGTTSNSPSVTLVGAVPREKVFEYIAAADTFVLNTSFESFSFQVVEAMRVGTPVITTNIGNLPEIITHEKEGWLIDPNDKGRLKELLNDITPHAKRGAYKGVIDAAYEKSKQFSISQTLDRLCELFKE